MSTKQLRWDSSNTVFLDNELETMLANPRNVKHAAIKFREFLPINREGQPGDTSIAYESFDGVGEARWLGGDASDLPRVDVSAEKHTQKVEPLGDSFQMTLFEVQSAQRAGKPLSSMKMDRAREAIERKLDEAAALGVSHLGWEGFLNHSSVSSINAAATGTGSSRNFADKTADQIAADFRLAIETALDASNGEEAGPFRFLLPDAEYHIVDTLRVGDGTTTLRAFLESWASVESIRPWSRCVGIGAGSTDRMVMYTPDPTRLDFRIVQEFSNEAPQYKGLASEVNCYAQAGGFVVYYPASMLYIDQIG